MPEREVHHKLVFDLVRDYVYFLVYPFPGDGAAMKSTVYSLNKKFEQVEVEVTKKLGDKATPRSQQQTGDALQWVNRNLTEQEKADHDNQAKTPAQLGVLLFKVALQGYNVRIAWDAYSKCFQANLVPFQADNPNFGYAISARGVTPERAVSLLLYKHYAVFEEQWSNHYKAPSHSFEG